MSNANNDKPPVHLLELPKPGWDFGEGPRSIGFPHPDVSADFRTPREKAEWTRPAEPIRRP